MKFKNYVNSYTKDNRIYSKEDISNMSVRDAYGKKRAILAQNRRIGVPSDAELRNSSNVIWVNPYRREDGTEVKGYWRSKSGSAMGSTGGIIGDNNIPPMDEQSDDIEDIIYGKKKRTGDIQDIDMDGGDEEISPVSATVDLIVALSQIFLKDTEIGKIIEAFAPVIKAIGEKVFGDDDLDFEIDDQYSEQAEESIDSPENVQTDSSINPIEQISEPNGLEGTLTGGASEITPIKITDKGIFIDEEALSKIPNPTDETKGIAGVMKGEKMSLEQAGGKNVNPNYNSNDLRYTKNCQACIGVFEARLRGYDIEALPYSHETHHLLEYYPEKMFIEPETKLGAKFDLINVNNNNDLEQWLDKNIKSGERYMFRFLPKNSSTAHIVSMYRDESGKLVFYDVMAGQTHGKEFMKNFSYKYKLKHKSIQYRPSLLRTDNKLLNTTVLSKVSQPKSNLRNGI